MTVNLPTTHTAPREGDRAPDIALSAADGSSTTLSQLIAKSRNGVVLVFLRHFGCIFCREHALQLKRDYVRIRELGYDIVAIGHGTPARATKFAVDLELPFSVFADRELSTYATFGLGR